MQYYTGIFLQVLQRLSAGSPCKFIGLLWHICTPIRQVSGCCWFDPIPAKSATFCHGDWSWNIFCCHSFPSGFCLFKKGSYWFLALSGCRWFDSSPARSAYWNTREKFLWTTPTEETNIGFIILWRTILISPETKEVHVNSEVCFAGWSEYSLVTQVLLS